MWIPEPGWLDFNPISSLSLVMFFWESDDLFVPHFFSSVKGD